MVLTWERIDITLTEAKYFSSVMLIYFHGVQEPFEDILAIVEVYNFLDNLGIFPLLPFCKFMFDFRNAIDWRSKERSLSLQKQNRLFFPCCER